MRMILLAAMALLCSNQVHAQYGGRYICHTSSVGLVFDARNEIQSIAEQLTAAQCKKSGSTRNSDCDNNLWCEDSYYPQPEVRCETLSATLTFSAQSRNEKFARQQAADQCKASGSTRNSECDGNVVCFDPSRPRSMNVCETFSATLIFSGRNAVEGFARTQAVDLCKASGSTRNSDCDANVSCHNEFDQRAQVRCETTSHGLLFEAQNANRSFALALAISRCKASGSTSNLECESNAACTLLDRIPSIPRSSPGRSTSDLCFVRQTNQTVNGEEFFALVNKYAQQNRRCVIAKIANVPQSGRVYRADGSRADRERGGLSNREVEETLRSNGLMNCERFSCEELH